MSAFEDLRHFEYLTSSRAVWDFLGCEWHTSSEERVSSTLPATLAIFLKTCPVMLLRSPWWGEFPWWVKSPRGMLWCIRGQETGSSHRGRESPTCLYIKHMHQHKKSNPCSRNQVSAVDLRPLENDSVAEGQILRFSLVPRSNWRTGEVVGGSLLG